MPRGESGPVSCLLVKAGGITWNLYIAGGEFQKNILQGGFAKITYFAGGKKPFTLIFIHKHHNIFFLVE
jgi:hypothetical protein